MAALVGRGRSKQASGPTSIPANPPAYHPCRCLASLEPRRSRRIHQRAGHRLPAQGRTLGSQGVRAHHDGTEHRVSKYGKDRRGSVRRAGQGARRPPPGRSGFLGVAEHGRVPRLLARPHRGGQSTAVHAGHVRHLHPALYGAVPRPDEARPAQDRRPAEVAPDTQGHLPVLRAGDRLEATGEEAAVLRQGPVLRAVSVGRFGVPRAGPGR